MRVALITADVLVVAALLLASGVPLSPVGVVVVFLDLLVLMKVAGLYDRDPAVMRASTLDEVPRIATVAGVGLLSTWLLIPFAGATTVPRLDVAASWLGLVAGLTSGRMIARAAVRTFAVPQRVAIAGDPAGLMRLREKVEASRSGIEVVRVLPQDRVGPTAPELLSVAAFRAMRATDRIERLIFVPGEGGETRTVDVIRVAKAAGVRISVIPRLSEVVGSTVQYEDVDGLAVLGVRPFGLSRSARAIKRGFDIFGAALGVLAVAPVLALLALLVKLDSPGPVLFRQQRVGRDGEPFEMLKFRSMTADAEARKDQLRDRNETEGLFKIADDPRITRAGRLLRATSLDELPQLFNVLGGTMSLVGPRPLVLEEDALIDGLDRARLHLTPGMTGPWQVLGPTRVPLREMLSIDYLYVANWTLWRDVEILIRTVMHMVRGGGV